MWGNFAVGTGWGGKKLLDLIELDGFSEKEERLIVRTDSSYPDIGTYPAHQCS
jgi:hypothetical protein